MPCRRHRELPCDCQQLPQGQIAQIRPGSIAERHIFRGHLHVLARPFQWPSVWQWAASTVCELTHASGYLIRSRNHSASIKRVRLSVAIFRSSRILTTRQSMRLGDRMILKPRATASVRTIRSRWLITQSPAGQYLRYSRANKFHPSRGV